MKKEFKEFDRFQDLFLSDNIKTTKKFNKQLEKDAIKWFESVGAEFGKFSESEYKWHYCAGMLDFSFGLGGFYSYRYAIKCLHFKHWNLPSYIDGAYYGQIKKPNRDNNPYSKIDFFNHLSWDCGFVYSLYNNQANGK